VWVTGVNPKLITSYDAARAAWIFCSIITKIKTHRYVRISWSSESTHKDQWAYDMIYCVLKAGVPSIVKHFKLEHNAQLYKHHSELQPTRCSVS